VLLVDVCTWSSCDVWERRQRCLYRLCRETLSSACVRARCAVDALRSPCSLRQFRFSRQRLAIWSFTYTTRDSYATQCRDAWVPHTLNRILSYLTDKIRSDCWVSRRYTTRDATHNPAMPACHAWAPHILAYLSIFILSYLSEIRDQIQDYSSVDLLLSLR
jgi:hypothetical protein